MRRVSASEANGIIRFFDNNPDKELCVIAYESIDDTVSWKRSDIPYLNSIIAKATGAKH